MYGKVLIIEGKLFVRDGKMLQCVDKILVGKMAGERLDIHLVRC